MPLCLPIYDETAFLGGEIMGLYSAGTRCTFCGGRLSTGKLFEPCPHCGVEPYAHLKRTSENENDCGECLVPIPSFLDACPRCGWDKRQAA